MWLRRAYGEIDDDDSIRTMSSVSRDYRLLIAITAQFVDHARFGLQKDAIPINTNKVMNERAF